MSARFLFGDLRILLENVPSMCRFLAGLFLCEDTGVLYRRTRGPGRPLRAASQEEFESRYAERLPFYRGVADIEVEVAGRAPAQVLEEVLGCL